MELPKEFIDAVEEGNKLRVRIMLKDIMLVDVTLKLFNEMLSYAENRMFDLYDQHNQEVFIEDSLLWNEDYLNRQMVSVVTNFSPERIKHLKEIIKKLYSNEVQCKKTESIHEKSSFVGKLTGVQIAGGIITVAGAGALIGGLVKASVPIAIVGGVAIAGGVAMVVAGSKTED